MLTSVRTALRRVADFRQHESGFVTNLVSLYGFQGLNYLFPLIVTPFLLGTLGAAGFGRIAFAQAFGQYVGMVLDFGFNYSASREVSIHRADTERLRRIVSATMAAKGFLIVASALVLIPLTTFVPSFHRDSALLWAAFAGAIGYGIFPMWLFLGLEQGRWTAALHGAFRLLSLLALLAFVHSEGQVVLAMAILSGFQLAQGLAGLAWIRAKDLMDWTIRPGEVLDALRAGTGIFVSMAAIQTYSAGNILILNAFAAPHALGTFAFAEKLTRAAYSLLSPIAQALYVRFSRNSPETMDMSIRKVLRVLIPAFAMCTAALFLAPHILLPFFPELDPPLYRLASSILAPLPLAMSFSTCWCTLGLLAMGRSDLWRRIVVEGALFDLAAIWILSRFLPMVVAVSLTIVLVEILIAARSYVLFRQLAISRTAALEAT